MQKVSLGIFLGLESDCEGVQGGASERWGCSTNSSEGQPQHRIRHGATRDSGLGLAGSVSRGLVGLRVGSGGARRFDRTISGRVGRSGRAWSSGLGS